MCLIGLPGIDGHELSRRLRARPEHAGAILIALTGYSQERDREKAFSAGFDYHLTKPVDTDRLAALLAGCVRQEEAPGSGNAPLPMNAPSA